MDYPQRGGGGYTAVIIKARIFQPIMTLSEGSKPVQNYNISLGNVRFEGDIEGKRVMQDITELSLN